MNDLKMLAGLVASGCAALHGVDAAEIAERSIEIAREIDRQVDENPWPASMPAPPPTPNELHDPPLEP